MDVDLDALRLKFFGVARDAAAEQDGSQVQTPVTQSEFVVMEPKYPADARSGRLTDLVENGKVVGVVEMTESVL